MPACVSSFLHSFHNTEPEFRAYHLLSLMAQHGKFKGDGQAFLSTLQALRPEVKSSDSIRWVLKLQVRGLKMVGVGFKKECEWDFGFVGSDMCDGSLPDHTNLVQQAFLANNWVTFFALVDAAPYLLACLAHIYFDQVG